MTTDIRSLGANPHPPHPPREGADPGQSGKRPYHPPRLQDLGDLRGVTLGGSGVNTDAKGGSRDGINETSRRR
jgi:hypothetical protein